MTKVAFVFPGQGSQRPGMGRDLLDRYPEIAGPIFAEADDIAGFSVTRACCDATEDELSRTDVTQPAIFVTSLVLLRVLAERLPPPDLVAGHSLGEYPAMVAAGVLDWRDALRLVRRRGQLMAAVNERTPGAMAAVIGLSARDVLRICAEVTTTTGEVAEIANYNADTQHVVAGTTGAIERVERLAAARGAEKVVRLKVGAPFHCSLMRPVQQEFDADLSAVRFADPALPVVANVTAALVRSELEARSALRTQLVDPVRWRQTMEVLVAEGADAVVEVGPGRVLTGLFRRMYPEVDCYSAAEPRRVDKLVAELTAAARG